MFNFLFLGRLLGSSRGAMAVSEGPKPPQRPKVSLGSHCENPAACRRHEKTPRDGANRGTHPRRQNKNGIVGSSLPRPHPTPFRVPVARSDAERTLLGMSAFYDTLSIELLALIPTGSPNEFKAVSHKPDRREKQSSIAHLPATQNRKTILSERTGQHHHATAWTVVRHATLNDNDATVDPETPVF